MNNIWRRFMRTTSVRKPAAFLLVSALWFTSIVVAPAAVFAQTSDDKAAVNDKAVAKKDKKDKKDN